MGLIISRSQTWDNWGSQVHACPATCLVALRLRRSERKLLQFVRWVQGLSKHVGEDLLGNGIFVIADLGAALHDVESTDSGSLVRFRVADESLGDLCVLVTNRREVGVCVVGGRQFEGDVGSVDGEGFLLRWELDPEWAAWW